MGNTVNVLRIFMGKFLVTGRERMKLGMSRCVLETLVLRMGDGA